MRYMHSERAVKMVFWEGLTISMEIDLRRVYKLTEEILNFHTFSDMSRFAAPRQEPFHAASLDAKQAFGNVTPTIQSKTMRDFNVNATIASGLLREQIGGK